MIATISMCHQRYDDLKAGSEAVNQQFTAPLALLVGQQSVDSNIDYDDENHHKHHQPDRDPLGIHLHHHLFVGREFRELIPSFSHCNL